MRYRAESHLRFTHGPLSARRSWPYVQLPPELNLRTLALARQMQATPARRWRHPRPSSMTRCGDCAAAVTAYTLEPGLYGAHTADEFWFDRKEGFLRAHRLGLRGC